MTEYSADEGIPSKLNFVRQLAERGRVRVFSQPSITTLDADIAQAITEFDGFVRLEIAGLAPTLSVEAAFWGLRILENACRFLVYREIGSQEVISTLSDPFPETVAASTAYSVDLFLRFLPDVERLARGLAMDDPLVEQLKQIAGQWPLSSVGMPDVAVDASRVQIIVGNPSLRQLYVDRILERKDYSRLACEDVRQSTRAAIGAYPELAPTMIRTIETNGKTE